ncbi:MAG: hypothetical protein WDO15_10105 [Bacteroidota bacterium]
MAKPVHGIPTRPGTEQTITFNALAAKTFGDATFALTATSSSALAVSYSSSDANVATISGSTVTRRIITATQAGNSTFRRGDSSQANIDG